MTLEVFKCPPKWEQAAHGAPPVPFPLVWPFFSKVSPALEHCWHGRDARRQSRIPARAGGTLCSLSSVSTSKTNLCFETENPASNPSSQVWGQYISFPLKFPLGSTGLAAPAFPPRKQVGFKPSEDTKVLLYKVTCKAQI